MKNHVRTHPKVDVVTPLPQSFTLSRILGITDMRYNLLDETLRDARVAGDPRDCDRDLVAFATGGRVAVVRRRGYGRARLLGEEGRRVEGADLGQEYGGGGDDVVVGAGDVERGGPAVHVEVVELRTGETVEPEEKRRGERRERRSEEEKERRREGEKKRRREEEKKKPPLISYSHVMRTRCAECAVQVYRVCHITHTHTHTV